VREFSFRLDGLVALVTGVGPGIGQHVASAYAAAGAKVIVCARTQSKVCAVIDAINSVGGDAIGMAVDVGDQAQLNNLLRCARDRFGAIHVLFNNAASLAGIGRDPDDPFALTDEDWLAHFSVNVMAPYSLAKALVPGMRSAGYGSIINVLSTACYRPKPGVNAMAYGSTKAALETVTRYIAKE
jgi:NAD(P)-dependent dehydrogenase (short-subunit alcohol dehydrogenase family)